MDMSTLQNLMSKNEKKKTEAMAKLSQSDGDAVMDEPAALDKTSEKGKAAAGKGEATSAAEPSKPHDQKEASRSQRTKVYVCQYCDREFEDKTLMRDHEKQHLIGSQY